VTEIGPPHRAPHRKGEGACKVDVTAERDMEEKVFIRRGGL